MSSRRTSRIRQRGVALLALLALLVLGASWWLLSAAGMGFNSRSAADRQHNAKVLSLAKQALIGYVAHRVNHPANPLAAREAHPGRLPCPEADGNIGTPNEGVAANVCSLPAVGRLPWRTLGLDQLRDASNEPLWYVVSEGWTLPSTVATLALNSNTRGQLTVDGRANAAAALLIAPGAALAVQSSANCALHAQNRSAPAPGMNFRDYLECQNADTSPANAASFASAGPPGSFNDQLLAVSAADIWSVAEGAVAARLVRDVMPAMQSAFGAPYTDGAQWGASVSASTPMLPFALAFADGSTQPHQGSLPLWRSQGCAAGTDALCDPEFVYWETASADPLQNPRVVKRGGDATLSPSSTCAISSTKSEVICRITYGGTCGGGLGSILGGSCSLDLEVSVLARAENVGRALRTFNANFATNGVSIDLSGGAPWIWSPWTPSSWATPILNTGAASADFRGDLPPASCNLILILALLFPCDASETVALRIPIAVFQDHPGLTALFAADTEWFIQNRWYEAMYYGVAPSHAPGGAPHDCSSAADCLTVSGASLPGDVRALVGMTGYSLSDLERPNTNFNDYLDSTQNRDGDPAFEQKMAGRSFNDRFFAVSSY